MVIPAALAAKTQRLRADSIELRVESKRMLRSLARSFVPITMPSNSIQSAISGAFKIPLGVSIIAQIFVFFKPSYLDISTPNSKICAAILTFGNKITSGVAFAIAAISAKPHGVSKEFMRTIFVR